MWVVRYKAHLMLNFKLEAYYPTSTLCPINMPPDTNEDSQMSASLRNMEPDQMQFRQRVLTPACSPLAHDCFGNIDSIRNGRDSCPNLSLSTTARWNDGRIKEDTGHGQYQRNNVLGTYELPVNPSCAPPSTPTPTSTDSTERSHKIQTPRLSPELLLDDLPNSLQVMIQLQKDITRAHARITARTAENKLDEHKIKGLWRQLYMLRDLSIPNQDYAAVSKDQFIKSTESSAPFLAEYTDRLDNATDFAIVPTPKPGQKRCKVGRPRGKILNKDHSDDLARGLCSMHKEKFAFHHQVDNYGRDPWKCYPANLVDEED